VEGEDAGGLIQPGQKGVGSFGKNAFLRFWLGFSRWNLLSVDSKGFTKF
jgi:hypothetical protein